jgi:hypothetical protein
MQIRKATPSGTVPLSMRLQAMNAPIAPTAPNARFKTPVAR